MKKYWFPIFSLAIVLVLISCSLPNQRQATSDKPAPVTLRIAWWGGEPRHEATMEVIRMYERANPHVQIEVEYDNWDDYWKRIAPMAAANELPDIIQMDLQYLKPYAEKGLLVELTPYITNGTIDTQAISTDAIRGGKIDDNLYGITLGLNAPAVIVDVHMLTSLGIQPPSEHWTWDDFEQIATEVKKKGNRYGTNGMKPPEVFFPYFLRTKGQNLYQSDFASLGYGEDEPFVEYFSRQLRLQEVGAFPSPDVTERIKKMEEELIVKGESPIHWTWSNVFLSFSEAASRPLELFMPPGPGQKAGMFVKPSMFFSIARSSTQKKEAAHFINFFVNNVEANKLMKGERGVPVSSKVVEALKTELNPEQVKVFSYMERVSKDGISLVPPDPMNATEVVRTLLDISDQILYKKITPEEGAVLFRKRANEILAKNRQ
ncbi:ABC transporter substrate-binding protein [Brevibacillus migulae]|uniref:ABC transporter substrate-binding protein n=1 Tax=Brevibacillus migulae TaxID=1644114 RepID=UPI00106EF39A|nr:ABC transporter substrate-binding protein [Brevibacillus migulae]